MNTKQQYHKINEFIQSQYQRISNHTPVVSRSNNITRVGAYTIYLRDNLWQVQGEKFCARFYQKKLAILSAAFMVKKIYKTVAEIRNLDLSYDILLNDQDFYKKRLKYAPDNPIIQDRLSRADSELSRLNQYFGELEKKVNLQ